MPELPEVEVCRLGLLPALTGQRIDGAEIRFPRLRQVIPADLPRQLSGRYIAGIHRRGKYLLFDCRPPAPVPAEGEMPGWLLIHLGMSGTLRLLPATTPAGKHAHFDLYSAGQVLRFTDPRRFGVIDWIAAREPWSHRLLAVLGIEPLSADFTPQSLWQCLKNRRTPVKQVLMDAHVIVGIGNIYAAESLFRAGISPLRSACTVTAGEAAILHHAIQAVLQQAIVAGGSSLRDYVHADGSSGYFQIDCAVYDRAGLPCRRCGNVLHQIRLGGRGTVYCPHCQQ